MKKQIDNTQESQKSIIPNVTNESSNGGTAQLVDNRTATMDQRKLQETMNASVGGKANPIQRKTPKGSTRFQQIAATMGNKYGVDTGGLSATHNSTFPARYNAEATIQGAEIHFGRGMDTDDAIKEEVGHYIDNKLHGTPGGDKIINGQRIDTTREAAVQRMVKDTHGVSKPIGSEIGESKGREVGNEGNTRVLQRRSMRMGAILTAMNQVLGCAWLAANEHEQGDEDVWITRMTITQDIGGNACVFNCQGVHVTIARVNNQDHAAINIISMNTGQEIRIDANTTVSIDLRGVRLNMVDPNVWTGGLLAGFRWVIGGGAVTPALIRGARRDFAGVGSSIRINRGDIYIYGNWGNPTQNPLSLERRRTAQQIIINNSRIEMATDVNNLVTMRSTGTTGESRTYPDQRAQNVNGVLNVANLGRGVATHITQMGTVDLQVNTTANARGVQGWHINGTQIQLARNVTATIQNSNVNGLGTGNLTVLIQGMGFNNTLTIPMTQWVITATDIKRAIRRGMRLGIIINGITNVFGNLQDQDLTALAGVGNTAATYT